MANKKTKALTFADLPQPILATEFANKVEVPEFGEGSFVYVRELTVEQYNRLFQLRFRPNPDFDRRNPNGQDPLIEVPGYSEATFVAAWCSYDDQGDLVFGVDERAAEAMVGALPAQYLVAISRIHRKVLEISGFGIGEDSASTAGQEEAIAGAEKN